MRYNIIIEADSKLALSTILRIGSEYSLFSYKVISFSKIDEDLEEIGEGRKKGEYIPTALRSTRREVRQQILYAIGEEHKPGEFGMKNGPTPFLKEMLEVEGENDNDRIIRFNLDTLDGTDEAIWRWKDNRWVRMKEV